MNAAEKLARWMKTASVSQVQVAEQTGYPQGQISYFLTGKTQKPSYDFLIAVSKMMGVRLDWLLDDTLSWPPIREQAGVSLSDADRDVIELARRVDSIFGEGSAVRRLMGGVVEQPVQPDRAVTASKTGVRRRTGSA